MTKVPEYKVTIWNWFLAYGGALAAPQQVRYRQQPPGLYESYYGGRLSYDAKLSDDVLRDLRLHGIDYASSSDPADHVGHGFNGTFASSELEFRYLYGTLRLKNGIEYAWGAQVDSDVGFGGVVRLISSDIDLEKALSKLEERLTDPMKRRYFEQFCTLPRVKAVQWVVEED